MEFIYPFVRASPCHVNSGLVFPLWVEFMAASVLGKSQAFGYADNGFTFV